MTAQKKATLISSSTAGLLAVSKLIVGMLSGSVAVLASAIDSLLDLGASLFNYFALHNAEKPADETFNYGRGKMEAIAATTEGGIITISGLFIFYESILKLISNEGVTSIDSSLGIMIFSLIVTLLLVFYLNKIAKDTNNMVIKADALHYKTDLYTNGAVLFSLAIIYFFDFHMIDALMGAGIALYIIYSAYGIIKEGVLMLMDRALEEEIVEKIKEIIESEKLVTSYHYLRTRRAGKHNFVDVHLVFNREISLVAAHNACDNVEDRIRALDIHAEWVMHIHLDPIDDSHNAKEGHI